MHCCSTCIVQAGLSWQTILRRRAGYRRAFAAFDPAIVARYDDKKVQELVEDASIIRHRGKIISAINNARWGPASTRSAARAYVCCVCRCCKPFPTIP